MLPSNESKLGPDYSKFIYIDQEGIKVQPILMKLLIATAPKDFKIEEKPELLLSKFVTIVQTPPVSWMRPAGSTRGALFSSSGSDYENTKDILELITTLGVCDQQSPQLKSFDDAVILGSSSSLDKRFFELQNLMMSGVEFKKIYLIGSSEPISAYKPTLEMLIKTYPERFITGVKVPDELTEHGTMQFFIDNLKWPENFKSVKIIALPSQRKDLPDGKFIKPTTQDELERLTKDIKENLKSEGKPTLAIFSNPPFHYRQNLIFQPLAQQYHIETLAGKEEPKNVAVVLDELSRACYQLNQFLNVPGNADKIGLSKSSSPTPKSPSPS